MRAPEPPFPQAPCPVPRKQSPLGGGRGKRHRCTVGSRTATSSGVGGARSYAGEAQSLGLLGISTQGSTWLCSTAGTVSDLQKPGFLQAVTVTCPCLSPTLLQPARPHPPLPSTCPPHSPAQAPAFLAQDLPEGTKGLPRPCLAAERTESPGAEPSLWGRHSAGPGMSLPRCSDGQTGQGWAWCRRRPALGLLAGCSSCRRQFHRVSTRGQCACAEVAVPSPAWDPTWVWNNTQSKYNGPGLLSTY